MRWLAYVMGSFFENRFCKLCGQPAREARAELDGSITFLYQTHAIPDGAQAPRQGETAEAEEQQSEPTGDESQREGASHCSR